MKNNEEFQAAILNYLQNNHPEGWECFRERDLRNDGICRLGITDPIPGDVFKSIATYCDAANVEWYYDPEYQDGDGYPDLVFYAMKFNRLATGAKLQPA